MAPHKTHVLFVCLGNICRSPMAEGLFLHLVRKQGRQDAFHVESAGTAGYHVGEAPDPRTLDVLRRNGIQLGSRAQQVADADFGRFDWIFAMDDANLADLRRRCPTAYRDRLHKVLEPLGGDDVADPYYGGPDGFDVNFAQLEEALTAWLDRMP